MPPCRLTGCGKNGGSKMSLITPQFFRDYHTQTVDRFPDPRVTPHIFNAEEELITLAGETAVEEVEAIAELPESERSKADARKLTAFQNAAAELTMYSLIPSLNLNVTDQGIQTGEKQVEFGGSGYQTLSANQVEKLQSVYYEKAYKLISRYIPTGGGVLPVFTGETV
jgi:hypothetical protein